MLATSLLVVHDTGGGSDDDVTELAGRKKVPQPGLELADGHIVAGADDSTLVDASQKLDHNLAGAVVVDDLELTNVT